MLDAEQTPGCFWPRARPTLSVMSCGVSSLPLHAQHGLTCLNSCWDETYFLNQIECLSLLSVHLKMSVYDERSED